MVKLSGNSAFAFLEPALDHQDDESTDHGEDQALNGEDSVVGGVKDQLAKPACE